MHLEKTFCVSDSFQKTYTIFKDKKGLKTPYVLQECLIFCCLIRCISYIWCILLYVVLFRFCCFYSKISVVIHSIDVFWAFDFVIEIQYAVLKLYYDIEIWNHFLRMKCLSQSPLPHIHTRVHSSCARDIQILRLSNIYFARRESRFFDDKNKKKKQGSFV